MDADHRSAAPHVDTPRDEGAWGVEPACRDSRPGIARLQLTVLDTPDPMALARFYAVLVGLPIAESQTDHDWVELDGGGGPSLAFQLAPGREAPAWPAEGAMQAHLDVEVDDLDGAEAAVLEAGATKAEHQPGETFRVFLDPHGNPFCLVRTA